MTTKLERLTLDEKLMLVAGKDLWQTHAIERLGIPSLRLIDGPNGARGSDGNHGPTSTSFPVGAAMGATWDPGLIEDLGRALAHETLAKEAQVLLGPTVNIPRVPNAGRNFECFSEDPLLSGLLAVAWIRGLQSEGVSACIKHFVCNDQEHDRYNVDAVVDERALREIYLEPFRIAVEESEPWAVMSAYNSVNGETMSEHPMLETVLRDDFGFDGLVVSDWYGTYGPGVMASGLDLEMPGPARWLKSDSLRAAIESGEISEEDVDRKVGRLLGLMERTSAWKREEGAGKVDELVHRALARQIATGSIVLLTNNGLLPLDPTVNQRIAVIGELASSTPHQGGGSSTVNAHRVVSILEGIRSAVGPEVDITWTPGCSVRKSPPPIDPASLAGEGFLVEYFPFAEPSGEPIRSVTSKRSYLAFFGTGDAWVDYDEFSVRISGRFVAQRAGFHDFNFSAGGRLRVTVNGRLVADEWSNGVPSEISTSLELEAGEHIEMVIEFGSLPGETWRWLGVGCNPPGPEISIDSAVAAAADADVAVVVAGLMDHWESEGFDRPDLKLPGAQDELIRAVLDAQPNTVVVVTAGSAVEMPWHVAASAVVQAWYGGQEVGHAVADVLFGDSDPGGRLPITFPADSRQHPGLLNYPGQAGEVRYGEGIYVGYRGFDRLGLTPRFSFGHGLSYTSFDVDIRQCTATDRYVTLEIEVTNTGDRPGVEVVQVFAHGVGEVDRRLVAFEKLRLVQGETSRRRIEIPQMRLRFWSSAASDWEMPEGTIPLSVTGSFGTRTTTVHLRPD